MTGQDTRDQSEDHPLSHRTGDAISSSTIRYRNLSSYLRNRFRQKIGKISLDAGLSCPNRDGTISTRGCLFCNAKGSGTGASGRGSSPEQQLAERLKAHAGDNRKFIAYFQSFTNTYAPVARLERLWRPAVRPDQIVGLSIGTRPDCLEDDVLDLLADIAQEKEVWLELGLQSATDTTLERINRGHTVDDFCRAVARVRLRPIKIVAHIILGLPGEGKTEILRSAGLISNLGLDGVKIHSLYIPRDSGLANWYTERNYDCLTREEFVDLAVAFLEHISPNMVVHRLTGDPDPETLVAPQWALDKHRTINLIQQRLEETDSLQGRLYVPSRRLESIS